MTSLLFLAVWLERARWPRTVLERTLHSETSSRSVHSSLIACSSKCPPFLHLQVHNLPSVFLR